MTNSLQLKVFFDGREGSDLNNWIGRTVSVPADRCSSKSGERLDDAHWSFSLRAENYLSISPLIYKFQKSV